MAIIWILASFLFLSSSFASVSLKVGDVLLQPLECWSCRLIEAEEETIYSHVGVVIQAIPEVVVAEAYGKVHAKTLDKFLEKTEKGQKVLVIRHRENKVVYQLQNSEFKKVFEEKFNNLKYDHFFLWDNVDENGNEKLYCSELVAKLYKLELNLDLPLKRMHFNQNRELWERFFRGQIPDNEWGNSPADLHRSEMFYEVGEL